MQVGNFSTNGVSDRRHAPSTLLPGNELDVSLSWSGHFGKDIYFTDPEFLDFQPVVSFLYCLNYLGSLSNKFIVNMLFCRALTV